MPDIPDLLARARAARPEVRAAVLLHIARLASWTDCDEGRRLLDEAWAVLDELGVPGRSDLENRTRLIAAAVDPTRVSLAGAEKLPDWRRDTEVVRVLEAMIQHGHADHAVGALLDCDPSVLPVSMIALVVVRSGREDAARPLMLRAVERWKAAGNPHHDHAFSHVFRWGWKYLPIEMARDVIRERVRRIEAQPEPVHSTATLDPEGRYKLSGRSCEIFDVIDVVQDLDPELAARLAASDEQLRSVLERFPRGMRTIHEEAEERARQRPPGAPRGYVMMGSPEDSPYLEELQRAAVADDFSRLMRRAEEKYAADTDPATPNRAAMEYWPSVSRYRQILSAAAKRIGEQRARALLDHIPDPDVRLLAEVEMLATAQGLPEMPWEMRFQPMRSWAR